MHHIVHVAGAIVGSGLLVTEVRTVPLGVIWGRESEEMGVPNYKIDYRIVHACLNSVEMVLGCMRETPAMAVVDCRW